MVRTAPDRNQTRSSRISLVAAVGAAVLFAFAWWLMQDTPAPAAPQRHLTDVQVLWVCERDASHRRWAMGGYEPVPCPFCETESFQFPCFQYVCPKHKLTYSALLRYAPPDSIPAGEDGRRREQIVEYRYETPNATWQKYNGFVPCPVPGCTAKPQLPKSAWRRRTPDPEAPQVPVDPRSSESRGRQPGD